MRVLSSLQWWGNGDVLRPHGEIDKNTPHANFRGLHDAFAGDPASGSFKKQKTAMAGDAAVRTPSVFDDHDQDAQDYEMQEPVFQSIAAEATERDEDLECPEEDIIVEVRLRSSVSRRALTLRPCR